MGRVNEELLEIELKRPDAWGELRCTVGDPDSSDPLGIYAPGRWQSRLDLLGKFHFVKDKSQYWPLKMAEDYVKHVKIKGMVQPDRLCTFVKDEGKEAGITLEAFEVKGTLQRRCRYRKPGVSGLAGAWISEEKALNLLFKAFDKKYERLN